MKQSPQTGWPENGSIRIQKTEVLVGPRTISSGGSREKGRLILLRVGPNHGLQIKPLNTKQTVNNQTLNIWCQKRGIKHENIALYNQMPGYMAEHDLTEKGLLEMEKQTLQNLVIQNTGYQLFRGISDPQHALRLINFWLAHHEHQKELLNHLKPLLQCRLHLEEASILDNMDKLGETSDGNQRWVESLKKLYNMADRLLDHYPRNPKGIAQII